MANLMNDLELAIGTLDCGIQYCDLSGENTVTIGAEEVKNIMKLLSELEQYRKMNGTGSENEPRIITLKDFENNPNLDDSGNLNVWEEYRDGSRSGWNTINVNDVSCFMDIRRYWTDRPTEEQRRSVKWE